MTRFITSIPSLNAATSGFGLGELWAIAGKPNTFRTGLAYSIARDIVKLNKAPDFKTPSRLVLARGEGTNQEVLSTMRMVTAGRYIDTSSNPDKDVFNGGVPNKQGWVVQTRTDIFATSAADLELEIDQVQELTGERVCVVVFDNFRQFRDNGNEIIDLFEKLKLLCKLRNILTIVPTILQKDEADIKRDWVDGIIYTSIENDDRTKLTLKVINKRTGSGGAFDLVMKNAPEFGYLT